MADIEALRQEFGDLATLDASLKGPGRPLLEHALQAQVAAVAFRLPEAETDATPFSILPGSIRTLTNFPVLNIMEMPRMTSLPDQYRAYIACLNGQDWDELRVYVASDVQHNGRSFGLSGYRDMLINDFAEIPDLFFKIGILTCEPPFIAARLEFDCSPKGIFVGLPVNGRRVSFTENVFYRFREGRIVSVWSIIDKSAIEAQLDL